MEPFNREAFLNIKLRAESFYKSINSIKCPALNTVVHFTSDGFHHLQFDGTRTERSKIVQKNKMLHLEDAVEIIKKTTTIQEYRTALQPVGKADKQGFRQTKPVAYFAFQAITDLEKCRRINVVVRRVGEGNYHFWSVMPSWKEEQITSSQSIRRIGGNWMTDS